MSVIDRNETGIMNGVVKASAAGVAKAINPGEVRDKLARLNREMSRGLIERGDECDLVFTGLVAGEHVLFVGPPGCAKSMIFDSLVNAIKGDSFSVLLTKFTTPDEVMGPLSLTGLKSDRYCRVTANRLPSAHVAFIDEIFKASSAILNTMLRILNEGVFENDGHWNRVPLRFCVAASNEYPNPESGGAELGALFDRFLIRRNVQPIRSSRGIDRLLFGTDVGSAFAETVTPEEIDVARSEAAAMRWGDEAKEAMHAILRDLQKVGIVPSDRRKRKSVGVVKAAAWLAGSKEVTTDDLAVLVHTLWDDPTEQPKKCVEVVSKYSNPIAAQVRSLLEEADELLSNTDPTAIQDGMATLTKVGEIGKKLKKLGTHKTVTDAVEYIKEGYSDFRERLTGASGI